MTHVGEMLNDDEYFGDIVDTPKEGIEQHKKWECLKRVIDKVKGHLVGKWTHKRVDKASEKTIKKNYTTGIFRWLKIKDVKKLQQCIENHPIIKDQMAISGCPLVCTFGNFLAPVLVSAHTVNNLGLGNEQGHENEVYESEA